MTGVGNANGSFLLRCASSPSVDQGQRQLSNTLMFRPYPRSSHGNRGHWKLHREYQRARTHFKLQGFINLFRCPQLLDQEPVFHCREPPSVSQQGPNTPCPSSYSSAQIHLSLPLAGSEADLGAAGRSLIWSSSFFSINSPLLIQRFPLGMKTVCFSFIFFYILHVFKGCIRAQFLFLSKWIGESTNPRESKSGYGTTGRL